MEEFASSPQDAAVLVKDLSSAMEAEDLGLDVSSARKPMRLSMAKGMGCYSQGTSSCISTLIPVVVFGWVGTHERVTGASSGPLGRLSPHGETATPRPRYHHDHEFEHGQVRRSLL